MAIRNVVVMELGPLVSLEQAKAHLRVEHDDDDAVIEMHTNAAVSAVLTYCNVALVPMGAEDAFRSAALVTLTPLYEGSPVKEGIPPSARFLVDPYRLFRV